MKALNKKEYFPLLLILLIAFILRFYNLGHESFWCDELQAAQEADPSIPLSQLFKYLSYADIQPPLFFLIQRFFGLFGHSEIVGRFWPALAGVGAVWAMYRLGKEVLNRNLGLIAAAFTCVNYFAVYYAREDRPYSQSFFFAALSLAFFVRFVKSLRRQDMWYYSLSALLAAYTHYFGMILVFSQFCVALLLYFAAPDKKVYLKRFGVSAAIVAVGFAPWLPYLLKISQYNSGWIPPATQDFIFNYFNAYFGNSDFLKPVLAILLLVYLVNVFRNEQPKLLTPGGVPLSLSFVIFAISLVVTYSLPYIRSLLSFPMLFDRYTIVVLPIYLAAAAYGLELIANRWVKGVVFGIFIGWSVLFICLTDGMYTKVHKTQFREMTAFIAADPGARSYPVVNDRVMFEESYYLKSYGFKGPQFTEPRNVVVNSIVHGTASKYEVNKFWLIDAHSAGDPAVFLDTATRAMLDSNFVLEKEQRWHDAWAQLYVSKKSRDKALTAEDFPPANIADVNGKIVAIWGGSVTSNAISLPPGNYTLRVLAWGTPAKDVFAHLVVSAGNKVLGDFYTSKDMQPQDIRLAHPDGDSVRITVTLDNDFTDPQTHEDRNAFLKRIDFLKN